MAVMESCGRVALALGRAIRKIQQKNMAFVGPLLDYAAGLKTPQARLIWSHEPWTPQDRTRYNWGKRQEILEEIQQKPGGIGTQDPEQAAQDARRKTRARQQDHAKAINKVLDQVTKELAEDKQNAITSSLERSYEKVYGDIVKELDDARRAIDADKEDKSRIADVRDYTAKGDPRRTTPETQIPRNMPGLGNYGESVIFGAPSPDQVKTVLNAEFDGKNYSDRIWKDRDKLAAELKDMMAAAIINGENSRIVAQKLAAKMGVEFAQAERLIRTEMNRILNQAALDGAKAAGATKYVFIAIEDDRMCGRCQRKNGKIFKISEKKTGQNFPPLHPYCRCTVAARFEWEDEDEDDTSTTTPPTIPIKQEKEPGYFESSPAQMTASELEAVNRWLMNIETVNKAAADAVRDNPTQENIQAAADAQDQAMKEAEARQKVAIGIQKRAIQQGKPATPDKIKLDEKENGKVENKLPEKPSQLEHMFKEREGHLKNTQQNKEIIIRMANNKEFYLGKSKNEYTELEWYAQILDNGKQLWASVRNGIIQDCGINNTPRPFEEETGLCRNTKKRKKKRQFGRHSKNGTTH